MSTLYFLHIKGNPDQAVDALKAHGIDSFGPVVRHNASHGSQIAEYSNTSVPADYGAQVSRWFREEKGHDARVAYPIGALLHYSILD